MSEPTARVGNVRQPLHEWWGVWVGDAAPQDADLSADYADWWDYTGQMNVNDLAGLVDPRGLERWEAALEPDAITVDGVREQLAAVLASYVASTQQ